MVVSVLLFKFLSCDVSVLQDMVNYGTVRGRLAFTALHFFTNSRGRFFAFIYDPLKGKFALPVCNDIQSEHALILLQGLVKDTAIQW
jgi:hypothetical protein